MPWASARTVRVALAVRSLHRVEINRHRIQRKAIRSLYREKAIGSVYRGNRSAVYTGRTDPHLIQRRSNRQCIQRETESRKRLKHPWFGIHVKEMGDSEYLRE
jgi:hypothetical protein